VQSHAYRGELKSDMHKNQASTEGVPSPPRSKPAGLTSIAIQSFASFRSQTSANPVPVVAVPRRKPLPADSPVAGQFEGRPSAGQDKDSSTSFPGLRRPATVLSPPLTADELIPRNLDE
jgi:hypothetical protein